MYINEDFFNRDKKENEKDKNDIIIAFFVIVVFSVFVYKLMFSVNDNDEPKKAVIALAEDEVRGKENVANKPNKEEFLDTNSDVYERKAIKAEDAYTIQSDSAIVISDVISTKAKVINEVSKPVSEVKTTNDIAEENSIIETEEVIDVQTEAIKEEVAEINTEVKEQEVSRELIDSNKNSLEEEIVKVEEKEVLPEVTEVKESIVEKTMVETQSNNEIFDCVIVVGAFREESNKITIIKKLQSLGYSHTDGILRKGLNYVGVPVECDNKSRKVTLLRELNEAFGIESWVKKM